MPCVRGALVGPTGSLAAGCRALFKYTLARDECRDAVFRPIFRNSAWS